MEDNMRYAIFLTVIALSTPTMAFSQEPGSAASLEEAAPAAEVAAEVAAEPKEELPALDVPADDEEAIQDVQEAVGALQTGQWATFVILLLGLLAFGYNKWTSSKAEASK